MDHDFHLTDETLGQTKDAIGRLIHGNDVALSLLSLISSMPVVKNRIEQDNMMDEILDHVMQGVWGGAVAFVKELSNRATVAELLDLPDIGMPKPNYLTLMSVVTHTSNLLEG